MIVMVPAGLFIVGFFVYAAVQQLILGRPFGDDPMSDEFLAFAGPFYILLGVLILYLYFGARLMTEVRPDGVFVRFSPFHRRPKHFAPEKIVRAEAVTYRPIRDYGGWGVRFGPKGRAYNTHGDRGVRLEFTDGRPLLIGSQQPETLANAIDSIKR